MKKNKRRRCLGCRILFRADPRTRTQQKYCSHPDCRIASKKASQQRWLDKPENQGYFSGPQHVARVRIWRASHPESRKRRLRQRPVQQETRSAQAPDATQETRSLGLQEMRRVQTPDVERIESPQPAVRLQDAMG